MQIPVSRHHKNEVDIIGLWIGRNETPIDHQAVRQSGNSKVIHKFSQSGAKPGSAVTRLKSTKTIRQFGPGAVMNTLGQKTVFVEVRYRHDQNQTPFS